MEVTPGFCKKIDGEHGCQSVDGTALWTLLLRRVPLDMSASVEVPEMLLGHQGYPTGLCIPSDQHSNICQRTK